MIQDYDLVCQNHQYEIVQDLLPILSIAPGYELKMLMADVHGNVVGVWNNLCSFVKYYDARTLCADAQTAETLKAKLFLLHPKGLRIELEGQITYIMLVLRLYDNCTL